MGIKNFCQESFDTGIVKKLGKFLYWDKILSYEQIRVSLNNGISAYPKPAKLPHVTPRFLFSLLLSFPSYPDCDFTTLNWMTNMNILLGYQIFLAFQNGVQILLNIVNGKLFHLS